MSDLLDNIFVFYTESVHFRFLNQFSEASVVLYIAKYWCLLRQYLLPFFSTFMRNLMRAIITLRFFTCKNHGFKRPELLHSYDFKFSDV